jgi:hypothetical protein
MTPSPSYLAEVIKIIARTVSLANLPPLTVEELTVRSRDWADALFVSIPESRLWDAFNRALADHETTYPVSFFELKAAWINIEREERIAEYKRREAVMDDLDRKNRLATPVCPICRGTGFKEAAPRESYIGRTYSGVERSYNCCDYWEKRRTQTEANRSQKVERD